MICKGKQIPGFILTLLVLLTLAYGQSSMNGDHALSVASMPPLLELEKTLIDNLEDYANALQQKLETLRSHIPVIRAENEKGRKDALFYLSNPLNSFSLIRRLHQDWPKWRQYMEQPVGPAQIRNLNSWLKDVPKNSDLNDACAGIARIQNIYSLQVEDLVRGKIDGKEYNISMSSADIFAVGHYLENGTAGAQAVPWLQVVLDRFQEDPLVPAPLAVEKIDVLKLLAKCHLSKKLYAKALTLLEEGLKLQAYNADVLRLWQKAQNSTEVLANCTLEENKKPECAMMKRFRLGCKGLLKGSTRLRCSYNFTTTPFLRLAPLKVEKVGLHPSVELYHDVLSPRETAQLIELASVRLRPSSVIGVKAYKRIRTAKARWINRDLNELTRRILRRIRDMTGLDLTVSEKFQVINYGLGGHYFMHKDYFNRTRARERMFGDRVATVLFYLTDVDQGGATVFPESGYTIYPRAGTALLWYNLHTNGSCDPSTMHAACPVIVGSKWVMTEWISERRQIFIRPCRPLSRVTSAKS
ncbi:prolyl 4-hydroxylase subunit alpha-1 [Drosophila eugracilis]|uniref:prolyl 4-hydroxylase subunit alpha-1 n=1 Tax=Drosophila eugracilis TaxID=29029 RepID=UPI001BDB312E|nr:prolyl 4-hydroxylase subunit alpha-1 [Drosophila eugracilis]